MIKNCNTKNPLLRDGTSQQQRLLKALLPSYVSVDERSMADLMSFAVDFGKEINYFTPGNTVLGNWQSFFQHQVADRANQATQPHYALFLAFLELFRIAQEDLNTITKRHLEFYYKDVLKLKEREAIPDQVFIIFKLAQNVASHLLPEGTELDAKKDNAGINLIYDTAKDLVLNKTQVKDLKAVFYNKKYDQRVYASPIANSNNGLGEEIPGAEKKWATFGAISDPSLPYNSPLINRGQARLGFALASPILFLGEGTRTVKIELTCDNTATLQKADLSNAFSVYFSGEKEWLESSDQTKVTFLQGNKIIIHRTLASDQPAVVPYNDKVLMEGFVTKWPVAKIVLNTDGDSIPYIYAALKSLVLSSAGITVEVAGIKNLVLQNGQSRLDASKPFQPFGNRPVLGSSFYIGSNEIFRKPLLSLDVSINWQGLPEDGNGFYGYYHDYIPYANRQNSAFRANLFILENKSWKNILTPLSDAARLFDSAGNYGQVQSLRNIHVGDTLAKLGKPPADFAPVSRFDNSTLNGFLRLDLAGADFGHKDFQNSFATQALKAAVPVETTLQELSFVPVNGVGKDKNSKITVSGVTQYPLPNEPYTPVISDISLNYTATVTVELANNTGVNNAAAFARRVDQFFHIEPFGVAEYHPYLFKSVSLMPDYDDEGSLYIGLSDLKPAQTLSVLFRLAEGTSDPDLLKQKVSWSYMANNVWIPFPPLNIVSDSTNDFLRSGILVFDIPKAATSTNTLLPAGLHWLKASVADDSLAVCEMIDIRTQAVSAVFVNNGNDPAHYASSLPAGTIADLVDGSTAIEKVEQPYASFGGRMKEQSNDFFVRISERLRHKNRAVTMWDYEHLVLEKFASIYKAKCMNHARFVSENDFGEVVPGHVSLVVVSNVRNQNAVNPLKPKTSLVTLNEIRDYIAGSMPPCVELHVKNPIYEEILLDFNVRFLPGFDTAFYSKKLEEDIKKFLSPWAYEVNDVSFGGVIHKSVILNFVEEQPYVDFVSCFRMDHIYNTTVFKNVEEARATTSASILTSASVHNVHVLETDDCACDDNLVDSPFEPVDDSCECDHKGKVSGPYGIGAFKVMETFIVGDGSEFPSGGIGFTTIGELDVN